MKKIILLTTALFCLCQVLLAQQRTSSQRVKKISSHLKQASRKDQSAKITSSLSENLEKGTLPSVNAVWLPAKMIESSWDTISNSWAFMDSIIYTYNANGDITLELRYYSFGKQQTLYTYNANAKLTQMLAQLWNGSTWDNSWKNTYTYDANNNLIEELSQSWNSSLSTWVDNMKDTYTYDANNNQIEYIGQDWNTSTSSWDNQWKSTYMYDVNNNQIQYLSQNWNSSLTSWSNQYKDNYTYNPSNQMTQIISQDWNVASWDNDWKEDLTYNGTGVVTDVVDYTWNGSSWDNDAKYINIIWYQWTGEIYTSILQSYLGQSWDGTAWQNDYRETITHDAQGNPTDNLSEVWQTGVWVTDYETKDIYLYDANNNMTQDIYQSWVEWLGIVRNYWKYDYSNYSSFSGIHENASISDNVILYPNPTHGKINFIMSQFSNLKIENMEVYNIYGAKVYCSKDHFQVDLSSQPNGIYVLKMQTEAGLVTKKIIKE